MSPAEIKREIQEAAYQEYYDEYAPRCSNCEYCITFVQEEYPDELKCDIGYCKEFGLLVSRPYEPSEEAKDCLGV